MHINWTLPATLEWLHPVFNISVLKRYKGQVLSPPDPIELDTGPEFEVEAILCHWWVGSSFGLTWNFS